MMSILISLLLTLRATVRSRAALHLEVLALRHQLQVLQRSRPRRLRLAYAERLVGSIRRECLDHVIVANERGLRRILLACADYYLKSRTHLALAKDAPVSRPAVPPGDG